MPRPPSTPAPHPPTIVAAARAATLLAGVGLSACGDPYTDPALTGVLIRPTAGEHEAPADLGIRNRTGDTLTCSAWALDECPDIGAIDAIPDGSDWTLDSVTCVGLDVACWRAGDPQDEVPLRAWTWSVKPDEDEP